MEGAIGRRAMPVLLGEADLAPLVRDPTSMDSLIDAMERATIRRYQGKVRDHRFVDETQGLDPNTVVQLSFAADDDEVCGYQMFSEDVSGMAPTLSDARFVTLLDSKSRQMVALVDYRSISPLRVGATGGIGMRRLMPDGAKMAGILGTAQQARGQLHAIARTAPNLEVARVYSRSEANREAFAREMSDFLDIDVQPVATAHEASAGADVIAVANSSGDPILEMAWVKPGALIVSIGGSAMPDDVLNGHRIVSTNWEQHSNRRPYKAAIDAGRHSRQHVAAEIAEVALGTPVRQSPDEIVVFELGVLNIWAVAAANWAYKWAAERGIGTPFSLSAEA
jgi:ornithine cyclodeaminase/alanine dehydrogenase-like protein (mu-crystallin family)